MERNFKTGWAAELLSCPALPTYRSALVCFCSFTLNAVASSTPFSKTFLMNQFFAINVGLSGLQTL